MSYNQSPPLPRMLTAGWDLGSALSSSSLTLPEFVVVAGSMVPWGICATSPLPPLGRPAARRCPPVLADALLPAAALFLPAAVLTLVSCTSWQVWLPGSPRARSTGPVG